MNFSAPAVPPPQNPPLPGPGQYDIVDYRGPPKHYISSAVFVSNTKRWTGDKFHKGIPGPGENITAIKCPYSRPDNHPFESESEAQKRSAGWLERPRASEKENQKGRLTNGNYKNVVGVSGYLQGIVKEVKMAALTVQSKLQLFLFIVMFAILTFFDYILQTALWGVNSSRAENNDGADLFQSSCWSLLRLL